jgi:hypothetical protein
MNFEISDYIMARDAIESKNPARECGILVLKLIAPCRDRTPDLGHMAHVSISNIISPASRYLGGRWSNFVFYYFTCSMMGGFQVPSSTASSPQ